MVEEYIISPGLSGSDNLIGLCNRRLSTHPYTLSLESLRLRDKLARIHLVLKVIVLNLYPRSEIYSHEIVRWYNRS